MTTTVSVSEAFAKLADGVRRDYGTSVNVNGITISVSVADDFDPDKLTDSDCYDAESLVNNRFRWRGDGPVFVP